VTRINRPDKAAHLLREALRLDDSALLDAAIDALRSETAASPDKVVRAASLSNLSNALRSRFDKTGAAADLDEAIDTGRQAIATAPLGDQWLPPMMVSLSSILVARSERRVSMADLDEAIDLARRAVEAVQVDAPLHFVILDHLSSVLAGRFNRSSAPTDLDEAIDTARRAAAAAPHDDPLRVAARSHLARLLRIRDPGLASADTGDEVIETLRQAVALTPPDRPERAGRLSDLGGALLARFQRSGSAGDLEDAVGAVREALDSASDDHPARVAIVGNLAAVLAKRFHETKSSEDLEEAIRLGRHAVAMTPVEHPSFVAKATNLCAILRSRYERDGMLLDLDEAIELGWRALNGAAPAPSEALENLATALRMRFERSGSKEDGDEAVVLGREAVLATAADEPGPLFSLGRSLAQRYVSAGSSGDLEEAIDVLRRAVRISPSEVPDLAALITLGTCLARRFEHTNTLGNLEEAIGVLRRAVVVSSPASLEQIVASANLGTALFHWSLHTGSSTDLDESIGCLRKAIAASPTEGHIALTTLGAALHARAVRTGAESDLIEAISSLRRALSEVSAEHVDRAGILMQLGSVFASHFSRTQRLSEGDQALDCWEAATRMAQAPLTVRATSAQLAAGLSARRREWTRAVDNSALAIELIGQLVPRSLARRDQEHRLRPTMGLATDAVACSLELGQTERAVELWERGRGVLLGQALDLRADTTRLAQHHPRLAARFEMLRQALASEEDTSAYPYRGIFGLPLRRLGLLPQHVSTLTLRSPGDRRVASAEEFAQVVTEIRGIPGFEHFLGPPRLEHVRIAGNSGPIVLVNVSDIRCDALLLTKEGIEVVALPDLSAAALGERVVTFLTALDSATAPHADGPTRRAAEEHLTSVLEWLWDVVAAPVLDGLGITKPPGDGHEWPRVWWCPSGLLSFLPLHASGRHETRFDPSPQTVLDRVVSSYAPTVRALLHARRPNPRDEGPVHAGQMLVVALPHTPGEHDLPGALEEAALLARLFDTALLEGPSATWDEVRNSIPRYPYAHFACHGESNLDDPSSSCLLLHDADHRRLTVLDVTALQLGRAEFAYLSGCSTARTGSVLIDESIHLAGAFQLAGYRQVIATLWPVGDRPAARIAEHVYTDIARNGSTEAAAHALHEAIRQVRSFQAKRPSVWAAHTHVGA
jgi:tetratricopeptide (TPR) repeat protein